MQGDFTRLPFDPLKRDSRVYLQQGRVQLDADWNTQVDLITHYIRNGIRDLIGDHGAPSADPGFLITATTELLFDGKDDYILVGREEVLYFKDKEPFTLEVEFTPQSGDYQGGALISCEGEEGGYLLRLSERGNPEFHRYNKESNQGETSPSIKSTRACRFDTLNHLAVTFDGQHLHLYLNGVLVARRNHDLAAPEFHPTFLLGARLLNSNPDDFFNGSMENVRIWNHCRSQSQNRNGMNNPPPENADGLVAWWPIDEGQDTTIIDRVSEIKGHLGAGDRKKQPSWINRRLRIGVGRYYVEGIPCVNSEPLYYSRQPDYPKAPIPPGIGEGNQALVYLDVWERLITPMEDPALAEPALGGIDTSVRTRIVQQVRILPITPKGRDPENAPEWKELLAQNKIRGQLTARYVPGALPPKNLLYRVEIHSPGGVYGKPEEREPETSITVAEMLGENRLRLEEGSVPIPTQGQLVEIYTTETDKEGIPGDLAMVMESDINQVVIEPFPPDLAMEDKPKIRAISGFKWSRNNASHIWSVQSLQPESRTILLENAGRSSFLLTEDSWIELVSTERELNNRHEPLLQLGSVQDPTRLQSKQPLPLDLDARDTLRLRLWDQTKWAQDGKDQNLLAGLIPVTSEWNNLENGIQVRFEPRSKLKPGDYWQIPARAGLDYGLDWPTDENGNPLPKCPQGIDHHFAPLALIKGSGRNVNITDLRRILTPLTADGAAPPPPNAPSDPETPQPAPSDPQDDPTDSPFFSDPLSDIPEGCAILSQKPQIPLGFQNTGLTIKADPWSTWQTPGKHESRGNAMGMVALVNLIFVFFENGDVVSFNPAWSEWSNITWIPTPRRQFSCAAVNGQIHILGGLDEQGQYSNLNEIYDPSSDTWSTGAPMPTPRSELMTAGVGGVIIAAGGMGRSRFGSCALDVVEIYEPEADEWRSAQAMPEACANAASATTDGQLHLTGGRTKTYLGLFGGGHSKNHQVFDASIDTWSSHPDLPGASAYVQTASPRDDSIHVIDAHGIHHLYQPNRGYMEKEPVPGLGEGFLMTADQNTVYLLDREADTGYRYQVDSLLHIFKKES